jgi:hypothetical protein
VITYERRCGHDVRASGGIAAAGAGTGGGAASGEHTGGGAGVGARAVARGCARGANERGCGRWRSCRAIDDGAVLAATAARQKLGSLTASLGSSAWVLSSFSLWGEEGEGAKYIPWGL